MELKITRRASKAQLMTIIMLVLFMLMLSVIFAIAQLNVTSNSVVQTVGLSAASNNYGDLLSVSATNFAKESLDRAITVLSKYEMSPNLRKSNFIQNVTYMISNLMISGIIPNDTSGYPQNAMGNLTLSRYNASIASLLGFATQAVYVNETRPVIYQTDSYSIKVAYIERITINSSGNLYQFNIPVNATVPLNNAPDLFYSQLGIQRPVDFVSMSNLTSPIGPYGYSALTGNAQSYAYGTIYVIPSDASNGATCPLAITGNFNGPPLNQSLIIATYNGINLGSGTCIERFGGLITYIPPATPSAKVPYLAYSSASEIMQSLPSGSSVLLYGPRMAVLDIENLRSSVINHNFFGSSFTPSYLDRANGQFSKQSPNGIFTFSNYDTQASYLNGASGIFAAVPQVATTAGMYNTVSFWMYWSGNTNPVVFGFNSPTYDLWIPSSTCFGFNTGNSDAYGINPSNLVNKWTFVTALFFNGPYTGNNILYINGVRQTLSQCAASAQSGTASPNINIGDLLANYYFRGNIANVQLYNTALLPVQISQMYQQGIGNLPAPTNALIGWWPLNGDANDFSGNANNGVPSSVIYTLLLNYSRDSIFNTPSVTKISPIPGLLSCTSTANCGSNAISQLYLSYQPLELQSALSQVASFTANSGSSITFPKTPSALVGNANAITISMWVNLASVFSDIARPLLGGSSAWCEPNSFEMIIEQTSGNPIGFQVTNSLGCNGRFYENPNVATPVGSWTHVTGVYSGPAGTVSTYINGVPYSMTNVPDGLITDVSSNLFLAGYGTAQYPGLVSNLQIYGTALSSTSVNVLYSEGPYGLPVTSGNLVGWWPLNGDANDYSGNRNNGNAVSVVYPYFSGTCNSLSTSMISSPANEWQALGLS
jgi:hypothetical protein